MQEQIIHRIRTVKRDKILIDQANVLNDFKVNSFTFAFGDDDILFF